MKSRNRHPFVYFVNFPINKNHFFIPLVWESQDFHVNLHRILQNDQNIRDLFNKRQFR